MNKELTELLEQFQKQKKSAWDEICKLENELNIISGYTHDWTLGKHATFSFAEKELAKIIGEANIQPDVSGSFPLSFVEWMTGHDSDSIMQLFNDFNKWK